MGTPGGECPRQYIFHCCKCDAIETCIHWHPPEVGFHHQSQSGCLASKFCAEIWCSWIFLTHMVAVVSTIFDWWLKVLSLHLIRRKSAVNLYSYRECKLRISYWPQVLLGSIWADSGGVLFYCTAVQQYFPISRCRLLTRYFPFLLKIEVSILPWRLSFLAGVISLRDWCTVNPLRVWRKRVFQDIWL